LPASNRGDAPAGGSNGPSDLPLGPPIETLPALVAEATRACLTPATLITPLNLKPGGSAHRVAFERAGMALGGASDGRGTRGATAEVPWRGKRSEGIAANAPHWRPTLLPSGSGVKALPIVVAERSVCAADLGARSAVAGSKLQEPGLGRR